MGDRAGRHRAAAVLTAIEGTIAGAVDLALEHFGLSRDAEVEFVKFRENHVFRVRGGGVDRALRLHRPGYRSDGELLSEAVALEAFRARGMRVPAPARTDTGDLVAVFLDPDGVRRQATMQDWIPDAQPFPSSNEVYNGTATPHAGELHRLGTLVAELHTIASTLELPAGFTRAAWDRAGLVGPAALWGSASGLPQLGDDERTAFQAAERRLDDELAQLPTGRDHVGFIHADLTFENVLSDDRGLVVLDFDDSGEGWYLFDLATVGFWLSGHPRAGELLATMCAGYATRRPLTAGDARAWHPLLMARALSYLGWSADRPDDPTTAYHLAVVLPRVLAAARRYAATGSTGWPDLPALKEY